MMRTTPGLLAALVGCTYVTRTEYEDQLQQRDEDFDGWTVGDGDCNDADPGVNPGQEEIPYDDIDNDCGRDGDQVDVDRDGFIAAEVGGPDCRDQDPLIRPSSADAPYDGIDADCGAENDFDADGDGVMPDGIDPEAVAAYSRDWGVVIVEAYGDCNDFDAQVYPGAAGEEPYDGVDTNCDGADDFDADLDGYPIPEDCLDQPDPRLAIDPAEVHPGADDLAYDGIDADCGVDDDFDADGDGYVADGYADDHQAYEDFYGYAFDVAFGDCDDALDFVHPGALEALGSGEDRDCDGDPDGAPFGFGGLSWAAPRAPRLAADDDHLILGVVSDVLDDGVNLLDHVVTALVFDDDLGPAADPSQRLTLVGPDLTEPLDAGLAVIPSVHGFMVGSVDARSTDRTYSLITEATDVSGTYLVSDSWPVFHSGGAFAILASDLVDLGPEGYLWSCGADRLQVTRRSDLLTVTTTVPPTTSCFTDPGGLLGTACGGSGCATFELQGTTLALAPTQPYLGQPWTSARRNGDLVVAITDPDGLALATDTNRHRGPARNPLRGGRCRRRGGGVVRGRRDRRR